MAGVHRLCAQVLTIFMLFESTQSQFFAPPYFNIAEGRTITATSTCGVGTPEPELYCKLTGANRGGRRSFAGDALDGDDALIFQGQLCDYCVEEDMAISRPEQYHPPEYAIDGTERWWQSPPISRGKSYNEVNLTLDLGQEFHVAYVFIKMANSPRPGVWALERSVDQGKTWKPWQYFADSPSDCYNQFGISAGNSLEKDDDVLCTTQYSKVVPLENGEIVVSLVNGRPSARNFSDSQTLQEFTKATNVRLRLIRTKTLLGHLMAVARQDPTVTRRYFYSIKDISIGGRCVCNGHADVCDKRDPYNQAKLICDCKHNTCGDQCEVCCPGFVQKKWRKATMNSINACERCNCFNHADDCIYDEQVDLNRESLDIHGNYEGGGVCQNCRHNTEGTNCQRCKFGFYRPKGVPMDSPNVCQACQCDINFSTGDCDDETGQCFCQPEYAGANCDQCNTGYYNFPNCIPCDCNYNGTIGGVCQVGGGQCPCKAGFSGLNCDQCEPGRYNFPECTPCSCDTVGALSSACHATTGECSCRTSYAGRDCSQCEHGYYNYPTCEYCGCDPTGTEEAVCDKLTGQCRCKPNFYGALCDRCYPGFYDYPRCVECQCSDVGSSDNNCQQNGQCVCLPSFGGLLCDQCAPGHYRYPECLSCDCDTFGAVGVTCDQQTGQCLCRPNFQGPTCNKCAKTFYNYPVCEECNCNPAGAKEVPGFPLGGCGTHSNGILCMCKEQVEGHICDSCKPGYFNLNINNPKGCEECDCDPAGILSGNVLCNPISGQCQCKPKATGRRCNVCEDGTFQLSADNVFGCQDCNCDVGGSVSATCDKETGQCRCRPRVFGVRCERPIRNHYFPTLYQHQYELEDGHTPQNTRVRYGFDESFFPGFSWKGFAVFSRIQPEVIVDVEISKPSLFRLIYRYVNQNPATVTAEVTVKPETATDVEQSSTVIFNPTLDPMFATVSGSGTTSTFVLNPGKWMISLRTDQKVFVDYLILLPQAYYEATILQEEVEIPCTVHRSDQLCIHYVFADVSYYPTVTADVSYTLTNNEKKRAKLFDNRDIKKALGDPYLGNIDKDQQTLFFDLRLGPGRYILLTSYFNQLPRTQTLSVQVGTQDGPVNGFLTLQECGYSSLCRQIITDEFGRPLEINNNGAYIRISLTGDDKTNVQIASITAIPVEKFNVEYLRPQAKCIRRNDKCIETSFPTPVGTLKTEFELGPNERRKTDVNPPDIDINIGLVKLDRIEPSIDVDIRIGEPNKPYVFTVQYYNPHNVSYDVDVQVEVDGKIYNGVLHIEFCPNIAGCRGTIKFPGETTPDAINVPTENVRIVLTSQVDTDLWLDYILAVPEITFRVSDVTKNLPVDRSGDFIRDCAGDVYDISPDDRSVSAFCRKSIFTLTTEYNNGALHCRCNTEGSLSFTCNEFGGQCRCRDNVIGRTCSECKTGYFGFPDCKPCNCPAGYCDPENGQCLCPAKVTGANCDTCLPQTFGYDALIGCEDCACDVRGTVGGDEECDVDNGQCNCLPFVGGQRCDKCVVGAHGFPDCQECLCDTRGTIPDVCDASTAECLCKVNTEGPQCDICQQGSFFLEDRNPLGCTSCFCFGTTKTCDSSDLTRSQVSDMSGWTLTNAFNPTITEAGTTVAADVRSGASPEGSIMYWVAPNNYLGNKITSYGGKLSYTVVFTVVPGGDAARTTGVDVRLVGNNFTLAYQAASQPEPSTPFTTEVDLIESEFVHDTTGGSVTREQFMMALVNLEAVHIRASYFTVQGEVRISDVSLDIATDGGFFDFGEKALNVEQCRCPPNYKGSSCEECADGYYRLKSGPYLGVCTPCQCNGHADTCDPQTGECIGCVDGTFGHNCDQCLSGYYGDPLTGACALCECPIANPTNNFATGCTVAGGQVISCDCKLGYAFPYCDRCEVGYYGDPTVLGEQCYKCQCNNNALSCNDLGECVDCVDNTAGFNCERCQEWYHGDAIGRKDCTECACDQTGSESCDHQTGQCLCKQNVEGVNCDKCAPGTYGFDSGQGCLSCDCAPGSLSSACDLLTGQCECQPGVTGRRCDQCQNGYYNYGAAGCEKCQCAEEGAVTCDPVSGRCQCLPGVTGDKCDMCEPRWVLVPDAGCQKCDSCVGLLLDDIEKLDPGITRAIKNLREVSISKETYDRLQAINSTVYTLRPQVSNLIKTVQPIQLLPINADLEQTKNFAKEVQRKSESLLVESEVLMTEAGDVKTKTEQVKKDINTAVMLVNDTVVFIKNILASILSRAKVLNREELIEKAKELYDVIHGRDFSNQNDKNSKELQEAMDLLRRMMELHAQATDQVNRTRELDQQVSDVEDKLRDIRRHAMSSQDDSKDAMDKVAESKNHPIRATVSDIEKIAGQVKELVDMSNGLLTNATQFLEDVKKAFEAAEYESSRLDVAMDQLIKEVDSQETSNRELRPLVDEATKHANELKRRADELENLIRDTQDAANGALQAANAYQTIVTSIEEAMNASRDAIDAAEVAIDKSQGIGEKSAESKERSRKLKEAAQATKTGDLNDRLDQDKNVLGQLSDVNFQTKKILEETRTNLDNLPSPDLSARAKEAATVAMEAQTKATDARNKIQDILKKLPEDEKQLENVKQDILAAKRDMSKTEASIDDVRKLVPSTVRLLDRLAINNERVEIERTQVKADLDELKRKIAAARAAAKRISVGMQFYRNTTLQVRNPEKIDQKGSSSDASLFFKTGDDNGMLFYVGPDTAKSGGSNDYFALEIRDGQVVYQFDLGSGPTEIATPRGFTVNDGNWHEVITERDGKRAKLTVRTQDQPDVVVDGGSSGRFSILNLNKDTTKVFIGGIPASMNIPRSIINRNFVGCIEEVQLNGVPVGLWDYVEGVNNQRGCVERDTLRESTPTESVKLDGVNSYVVMDISGFLIEFETDITFRFKTLSEDGLLFFVGKKDDYFSLELIDGKVVLEMKVIADLEPLRMTSASRYNDNKIHSVRAFRSINAVLLDIDNVQAFRQDIDQQGELGSATEIYFGGYPGQLPSTGKTVPSLAGCLMNVDVAQTQLNLIENNKEAVGVIPGCASDDIKDIHMIEDEPAFVAMPFTFVPKNFDMTLKIKTNQDRGQIFYVANDDQKQTLALAIENGKIVLTAQNGGPEPIQLTTDKRYDNGIWHYVTITKKKKTFTLSIDDDSETLVKTATSGKSKISTSSPLYFGGVPSDYKLSAEAAGTTERFIGCMGEVSVNGKHQDFSSVPPEDRIGIFFSSCPLPDPVTTTVVPTTLSPGLSQPLKATKEPDILSATEGAELPSDQCALPLEPKNMTLTGTVVTSKRFGTNPESRCEFDSLPSTFSKQSEFSLEFKTNVLDGMIFFMADISVRDMQALYLADGQVNYQFNPGSGPGLITSSSRYDDGDWHKVTFKRKNRNGELFIDGVKIGADKSKGSSRSMNVIKPYYVGGIAGLEELRLTKAKNLVGTGASNFMGCLKNFMLNGAEFGMPDREYHSRPCTDDVEMGTFFSKEPGYLILDDKFKVGTDIVVTFDIRPRVMTGVLFAVMSPGKDYLVIQLVNGELVANARNGNKDLKSIYSPSKSAVNELCDGQWHSVKVTKSKNIVVLEVDGTNVPPGIGDAGVSSTDTNDPLYIGGVPDNFDPENRVVAEPRSKYVGCLRNLLVNDKKQDMAASQIVGTVNLHTCPTT